MVLRWFSLSVDVMWYHLFQFLIICNFMQLWNPAKIFIKEAQLTSILTRNAERCKKKMWKMVYDILLSLAFLIFPE